MGFLQQFLSYKKVCLQCHNLPDADSIASAYGIYRYLTLHGVQAKIVYGGDQVIRKPALKLLLKECGIPISYGTEATDCDLLITVDCQYGNGNVQPIPAQNYAVVDHHIRLLQEESQRILIRSDYQSCSALVYSLLLEEGYPVQQDNVLCIALLYGLYTDTSGFADLYRSGDLAMKEALFTGQSLFDRLIKSNMTVAELLIASDALLNHYFDPQRHFALVEPLKCDQTVLGVIGDFIIQVDVVYLSFAYTQADDGYQISLRTCHEKLPADKIAQYICREIGSGGGHKNKAGGRISAEKLAKQYPGQQFSQVVHTLLCEYIDANVRY